MNSQKVNDESIDLKALQQKDKLAFIQLVDQNSDRIYRLALKMVGNERDAEDILQETFIKAYTKIEGFKGHSKVATWLYRITVNEALMLLRKRKNGVTSIEDGIKTGNGDVLPKQIIDWCCLPENELMNSESRAQINKAIKTLSEANRAAFLLRDVEGLSTRETAEILDITESAVKVRLMRARLKLREELTAFFADKMMKETI